MWHRIRRLFRSILPVHRELSLGEKGELAAVKFLRNKKYRVVDRNVRFPAGEIDIVAVDGRTVVFVEVKTRRSAEKGEPWEAVDREKRKRIVGAAATYLRQEELDDQRSRFDIVAITWLDEAHRPQIEHLLDAFDESDI